MVVSTGFTELDKIIGGLQGGNLYILGSRPAMGKTGFALCLLKNISMIGDKDAAYFTVEMSKEMLVKRLMLLESQIDRKRFDNGQFTDSELEKILDSADKIGNSKVIIDDTPGISIEDIKDKCRELKQNKKDISVIIIDYLQLISGSSENMSRQQEVTEVTGELKKLARELDIPVLVLSQLTRAVETRDDHRPVLSDFRESASIEDDADVVMFLYRDDYYDNHTKKKGIAEINVAKNRYGSTGTCELKYIKESVRFTNI